MGLKRKCIAHLGFLELRFGADADEEEEEDALGFEMPSSLPPAAGLLIAAAAAADDDDDDENDEDDFVFNIKI